MKVKIKKGDIVEIISGREADKGKRGEVIRVVPEKGRVVVQGVNMRKKHQKQQQVQGRTLSPGIIEFEAPLHISNVMLVCQKCNKLTRVAVHRDGDGDAQRVCKHCQTTID